MRRGTAGRIGFLIGNLITLAAVLGFLVASIAVSSAVIGVSQRPDAPPAVAAFARWLVGAAMTGGLVSFLLFGWFLLSRIPRPGRRG